MEKIKKGKGGKVNPRAVSRNKRARGAPRPVVVQKVGGQELEKKKVGPNPQEGGGNQRPRVKRHKRIK